MTLYDNQDDGKAFMASGDSFSRIEHRQDSAQRHFQKGLKQLREIQSERKREAGVATHPPDSRRPVLQQPARPDGSRNPRHRTTPNCATLGKMARAAVKLVFAALLALVATQYALPSPRFSTPIEIVASITAEQKSPSERIRPRGRRTALSATPSYASAAVPEPDTTQQFQLPPPALAPLA
jgi:hypothetical protein